MVKDQSTESTASKQNFSLSGKDSLADPEGDSGGQNLPLSSENFAK
jgi:hypothetical protein